MSDAVARPVPAPPPLRGHADAETILSVEHLRTSFFTRDGVVPAVNDVSFAVRRGEILGLVGESGSGKSVTARSVMRLVPVPGRIVDGAIWFKARNLLDLSRTEMRRVRGGEISMVLQEPMTSLNPVLTIGDQVGELYRFHPEHAPQERSLRDSIAYMLGQVRIPDAARRLLEYPMHFSGGMRQRVSIAMAAACRPDLIIADEPTTALDVTIQAQVLDLLLELRDTFGVSLLFITHDMGIVAQICDAVAVMYAGRIVEYAAVEELFAAPQHPYTRALLRSLPTLERRGGHLPSIAGQPPDLLTLDRGCPFADRCDVAIARCRAEEPDITPIGPPGNPRGYVRCWLSDDAAAAAPSRDGNAP
jgi:oligopeptide/dipeptide ABC transporter ATP-binding protein